MLADNVYQHFQGLLSTYILSMLLVYNLANTTVFHIGQVSACVAHYNFNLYFQDLPNFISSFHAYQSYG